MPFRFVPGKGGYPRVEFDLKPPTGSAAFKTPKLPVPPPKGGAIGKLLKAGGVRANLALQVFSYFLFAENPIIGESTALTSGDKELEALERWNREVGERQEIEGGVYSPLPEIQSRSDKFHVWGTYYSKNLSDGGCNVIAYMRTSYAVPGNQIVSTEPQFTPTNYAAIPLVNGSYVPFRPINKPYFDSRATTDERTFPIYRRDKTAPCLNVTGTPVGDDLKFVDILPQAGEPLDENYPGSKQGGVETNEPYPNIQVSDIVELPDFSLPPGQIGFKPVTKNGKIIPAPAKNSTSNSNGSVPNVTPEPEVKGKQAIEPTPTPEPLPELERNISGASDTEKQDATSKTASSVPKKIISTHAQRNADGTTVTTIQREATEEELKEANLKLKQAQRVINDFNKSQEITTNQLPTVEESQRANRENRLPTPADPNVVEEIVKTPALPTLDPAKPIVTPVTTDKTPVESDDPKPEDNQPPFIPPPPTQNPPDKCRGTCAGKNGLKLDKLSALLSGTNTVQNQGILGIVQNTNDAVRSTAYGLEKIQNFASTAWKVTQADKVMAGVNTALTIHNAMMLSNNILSTVSEATNMAFNALGIRDETDSPIDFGAAIKSKIDAVLASVLGAENYTALTLRIAKSNRIYQSSINLLDTTRALFDSARNIAESTAEHTGKIGNALRESGAVYEDAYEEFVEKVTPQNRSMRRLDKFRDGLESAENVFSSVANISGEIIEVKENVGQLGREKEELQEIINTQIETQKTEKDTAKTQIQVTVEINENDFDRAEDDTSVQT